MSLRKKMKRSLSDICKGLKTSIDKMETGEERDCGDEHTATLRRFLPSCLRYMIPYSGYFYPVRAHAQQG